MSSEIAKAHVQQFSSTLMHLLNQEGSMLRDCVRTDKVTGKYAHFDRLGRGTVSEIVSRHGDTPINDTAHSRRRVILGDYEWGDMIDKQDTIRMLINPVSDYAKAAAWDLGLKMDEIIIGAMNGNALSIDSSDSSSTVALPSSQVIDEDFGTGTDSNLTVEKLIEAKRIIMGHSGSMPNNPSYMLCNADAIAALLNEEKIGSGDYNSLRALVQGDIDTYMGFKFKTVKDSLLPGTADGNDTAPVKCFAFLQRSVGLAMGQDVNVEVFPRADKRNNTQVYATMSLGATRIEEEGVVAIECVQS